MQLHLRGWQYAVFLLEIKSRIAVYHLSPFLVLTMCKFLPEANSQIPVNSAAVSASESNFAALALHIRKELHKPNENLSFLPKISQLPGTKRCPVGVATSVQDLTLGTADGL